MRFERMLERLRSTAATGQDAARTVAGIIEDVRHRGDEAVVECMRRWSDPTFDADRIRVDKAQIESAAGRIDGDLRRAIEASIAHVRDYQQHIMPAAVPPIDIDGAEMSLRFSPVQSVALNVPGGAAVLFSTLIMLAVPALVAGVDPQAIAVLHPPPTGSDGRDDDISPVVLATCAMLGIDRVYRIGGAQAVAAAAFGTQRVDPVQMVAGPGNIYVQLAKAQLQGVVGTDGGFYGPSEILAIVDEQADPSWVAADLIAQAEHDPGKCFLVAWSRQVAEQVTREVEQQVKGRRRRDAIMSALSSESCAVLVTGAQEAVEVANRIACEHVHLAVADARPFLKDIRHAGAIFIGAQTPVAAGDYYAGPSHCLPTGTTARFTSGISVYTFLNRTGTVSYTTGMSVATASDIALLAETEGLDGHADSVRRRGKGTGNEERSNE